MSNLPVDYIFYSNVFRTSPSSTPAPM
jgi:hypothetical protein